MEEVVVVEGLASSCALEDGAVRCSAPSSISAQLVTQTMRKSTARKSVKSGRNIPGE